jgi:anti-sigma-K factor RskA
VIYDDAQDAVAAEYVLGTLSADEREHAEALLSIDPGFAEAVRVWERRLGELNVMVEAIEPPPQVWDKIRAELGEAAPAGEIPVPAGETAAPEEQAQAAISAEPAVQDATAAPSPLPVPPDQPARKPIEPPSASLPQMLGEPAAVPPLQPATKIERSAEIVSLARRVSYWRRMTAVVGAIAALLAIFIVGTLLMPGHGLLGRSGSSGLSSATAARDVQLVAVLQQEPMSPAFLLTIDPGSRTLTVRRVQAAPDPTRSYELWLVSKRFPTPRSLGIVGKDEFTQRAIPGSFDIDTMRAARYAVSLEPAGGSPSGVPTGPILFTGNVVESVPASAPPAPHT